MPLGSLKSGSTVNIGALALRDPLKREQRVFDPSRDLKPEEWHEWEKYVLKQSAEGDASEALHYCWMMSVLNSTRIPSVDWRPLDTLFSEAPNAITRISLASFALQFGKFLPLRTEEIDDFREQCQGWVRAKDWRSVTDHAFLIRIQSSLHPLPEWDPILQAAGEYVHANETTLIETLACFMFLGKKTKTDRAQMQSVFEKIRLQSDNNTIGLRTALYLAIIGSEEVEMTNGRIRLVWDKPPAPSETAPLPAFRDFLVSHHV